MTVSLCDSPNLKPPSSPRLMLGVGFVGSSEDTGEPLMFTSQDGNHMSGYSVGKNDQFVIVTDLVNYNKTVSVYVTVDLEYCMDMPGSTPF